MIKDMLKNTDIFSSLSDVELQEIVNITLVQKLKKDNILFYEGDEADAFYLLLEGKVKLYKTGVKSQEIVLHYFSNNAMIAEMATLEGINFPATCKATVDDTLVAKIDKEKFLTILKTNGELPFHIIKSLTKKIKNLELTINRNLIFDATAKVCSFLKENPYSLQTEKNIEIAKILNMAPETFSRTLAKLRELNILDQENNINDHKKLEMLLEF
jgi:CRP/FNR family transcriptional regulator, dissimilatory nitrate respiration regulator